MKEKENMRTRAPVALVLVVSVILLILVGWWAYRALERHWDDMLRAKLAYTTTGTVTDEKKFVIAKDEPYYINGLGDRIPETPGTEQWRIYFDIDNFDQVPEPKRTQLMEAEFSRPSTSDGPGTCVRYQGVRV